ncbi:MAG: hypothetical protein WCF66_13300, partial [Pseudolabrys sp.]
GGGCVRLRGALGTSAGGRGGGSPKIEPNCAKADGGGTTNSAATANNASEQMQRAIKARFLPGGVDSRTPVAAPG